MTTEDLDNKPLPWGKYKGRTPGDVAEEDPGYIVWLWGNCKDNLAAPLCSQALYEACKKEWEQRDQYTDDGLDDTWERFNSRR
jgi:hypothetical protein